MFVLSCPTSSLNLSFDGLTENNPGRVYNFEKVLPIESTPVADRRYRRKVMEVQMELKKRKNSYEKVKARKAMSKWMACKIKKFNCGRRKEPEEDGDEGNSAVPSTGK